VSQIGADAGKWEKVVRKVRTGSMPPAGRPRPDAAEAVAFVTSLESALDRAAASAPNPGRPAVHRLNRAEYANAIRDLLGVEVDVRTLLPADDADEHGFDNIADVLSVSPALLDRYMSAAKKVTRQALGRPLPGPAIQTYNVPRLLVQNARLSEDLPFGSRGGIAVRHAFPVDGEYSIKIKLQTNLYDYIRGLGRPHRLEVRVDGARVAQFVVGGEDHGSPAPASFAGAIFGKCAIGEPPAGSTGLNLPLMLRAIAKVLGWRVEQVRTVVNRQAFQTAASDEARIGFLYELFFQRPPTEEEVRAGRTFVSEFQASTPGQNVPAAAGRGRRGGPAEPPQPPLIQGARGQGPRGGRGPNLPPRIPLSGWQEYAHALLLTNEAAFIH